MTTITIAGQGFEVQPRYSAGHSLNANEASALNQVLFENLRNNFASKAKEGASQEDFDAYAASYQFGVRVGGGGGRTGDPVRQEALNIAREMVRNAIRNDKSRKLADVPASATTAAAERLIEKRPAIMDQARERVEQMRAAASESLDDDLLEGLEEASETATAADEATEGTEEAPVEGSGKRRRKAA